MAKKPNYGFVKYQKDLKRKKKQEEKRQRKLNKADVPSTPGSGVTNP